MDGIYLINKPENVTSYDVIRTLKTIFKDVKIGHAGTLDPFATGLLVILTGQMTKLSKYLINDDKTYEGVICFGMSTETYDLTGNPTNIVKDFKLDKDNVLKAMTKLSGLTTQSPPIYSAIKKDGRKLYHYAVSGQDVELPLREVMIHEFKLIDLKDKELIFKLDVSKGTYIRSIAHEIGVMLNIPAHLCKLNRTKSGIFSLDQSYLLKDVNETTKPSISLNEYASSLKKVIVKPYLERLVANGVVLDERQTTGNELFSVYNERDELLAIYEPYKGKYKPVIVVKGD